MLHIVITAAYSSWKMYRTASNLEVADDFRVTEISDLRTPLFAKGSVTLRFYSISMAEAAAVSAIMMQSFQQVVS